MAVKREKVVAMLSGGLDSTLAAKMMVDQGLEVVAFNMVSPFCTCTPKKSGCHNLAVEMGRQIGIEVVLKAKGEDYVEVIRNPKFGYGSGLNPCIDCRIYTFVKAKEFMEEVGAVAIVTGEVLGQRPMSQRRDAIMKIERESGLKGKILRPLSAACFPETDIEKEGIVDREKLLDIIGRGRTKQLEMAADIGLDGILCGTGGCLLTDKNMKEKILDLFAHNREVTLKDISRLKIGRHFRLDNGIKFVLGRDLGENNVLSSHRGAGDIVIEPTSFLGATALIEANADNRLSVGYVSNVIRAFAKAGGGDSFSVEITDDGGSIEEEIRAEDVNYLDYWIGQPKAG
ncbi:MAG: hypothetical protein ABIJ24_04175 [Nitrospinota bacterium]|nr:hypothetical protein [Nitrospinota bacterium]